MSAPVAGKFQDHYEVLGVEPKADEETIRAAFTTLSQKHAKDPKKMEDLCLALEVLTDVELRTSFNKLKGFDEAEEVKFGVSFFDSLARELGLRSALLCVLYDRRRTKMYTPSLSMRDIEGLLDASSDELAFAIWYLKQRSLVASDDKSRLQITVAGIDLVDREHPKAEQVLPFIKGAIPPAHVQSSTAASIISMLRRGAPEPARA